MKNLLYILLIFPLFFISSCEEETLPIEENTCYYNNVTSISVVRKTTDGGFILYGGYYLSNDNSGALLIKTDANGEEEWNQYIGISSVIDASQTTDDGHILLLDNSDYKIQLVKTNAYGTVEWNQTYTYDEYELIPQSIKQTTDGGYIVGGKVWDMGTTTNITNSVNEAFLIKVNSNGALEWKKMYTINDNALGLWNTANTVMEVQQTIDGGYITAGNIKSNGTPYIYLIKTNSDGNQLWTYIDLQEEISLKSIQQTIDGGYIVCGGYDAFQGSSIALKISSNGENEEWRETYGEFGSVARDIKPTSDGGYIIVGNIFSGDWNDPFLYDRQFLLKINNTGQQEWIKTFFNKNFFSSVQQAIDGGYMIGGRSDNSCGVLMKTDSEGNIQFIL